MNDSFEIISLSRNGIPSLRRRIGDNLESYLAHADGRPILDVDGIVLLPSPDQVESGEPITEIEPLSSGSRGDVYIGFDKKTKSLLALKVPHDRELDSEKAHGRVSAEQAVIKDAGGWHSSPNVLPVRRSRDNQGRWYNDMPLVDGTLNEIVENANAIDWHRVQTPISIPGRWNFKEPETGIPLNNILDLALQLADAYHQIHEDLGRAHGDGKLDNIGYIVRQPDGKWKQSINLQLLDKGNSTSFTRPTSLTADNMGHRYIRQPRLWHPGSRPDPTSDMYAWAHTVVKLVTGKYPLEDKINELRAEGSDETAFMQARYDPDDRHSWDFDHQREVQDMLKPYMPFEIAHAIAVIAAQSKPTNEETPAAFGAKSRLHGSLQSYAQRYAEEERRRGIKGWLREEGVKLAGLVGFMGVAFAGLAAGSNLTGELRNDRTDMYAQVAMHPTNHDNANAVYEVSTAIQPSTDIEYEPFLFQKQGTDLHRMAYGFKAAVEEVASDSFREEFSMRRYAVVPNNGSTTTYGDILYYSEFIEEVIATEVEGNTVDLDMLALRLSLGESLLVEAALRAETNSYEGILDARADNGRRIISPGRRQIADRTLANMAALLGDKVVYTRKK